MAVTDPVADYLTRIRNAQLARHRIVQIPHSKMKASLTKILYDQGYIFRYKMDEEIGKDRMIHIALKYDRKTSQPVIKKLERVSKPGLRKYSNVEEIPSVINGLGTCIVSTSKGVMTGKNAKRENVGGELLCYIY